MLVLTRVYDFVGSKEKSDGQEGAQPVELAWGTHTSVHNDTIRDKEAIIVALGRIPSAETFGAGDWEL